jgi:hypothetical protein
MKAVLLVAALVVGSDDRDGATNATVVNKIPPHERIREWMTLTDLCALLGQPIRSIPEEASRTVWRLRPDEFGRIYQVYCWVDKETQKTTLKVIVIYPPLVKK